MNFARSDERGMSLVEVLAALSVFAVITVGITPLLAGALRGTASSRARTVGRDAALQALERIRGLPYYVSYHAQPKKVDVLDLYFPCANTNTTVTSCAGEGTRTYDATGGVFSITCPAGVSGPSCAVPLPTGYSLLFQARFVGPDGATTQIPPSTYKRDPLPTETQLDTPHSQLIRLSVTARWSAGGQPQTLTLASIVGARKFGEIKISGLGRVAYGVQVLTSFVHTSGDARTSDLKAVLGSSESRVESRLVAAANQQIRAAEITLIRRATDTDPMATSIASPLMGIARDFAAPPNQTYASLPQVPTSAVTMSHPNLLGAPSIARIFPTTASAVSVSTSNELPSAQGTFGFNGTGSGNNGYAWVQNQSDTGEAARLKLDPTHAGVFSLRGVPSTLGGTTTAATGAVGAADRRVQTTASLDLRLLRVMPTTFLRLAASDEAEAFVVMIRNFQASVDCKSIGTTSSPLPTATWTARFEFWRDADQDGLGGDGIVELQKESIEINGTTGDVRAVLAAAPYNIPGGNPLVYDGLTSGDDLYLFDEPLKRGYLTGIDLKPPTATKSADGKNVSAGIDGAIRIATVPTNDRFPESGLNILVGSLTCDAVDRR